MAEERTTTSGPPDHETVSPARRALRERLDAGPLLLDGAMGTLLHARGVPHRACIDELVLSRPDLVGAVHREYIGAGVDIIETCSFGANRLRLAPFGLADAAGRIARRAAQLAREAREVSGRDVLVAGSVGPIGPPIHAPRRVAPRLVADVYREQVDGLLEGGVDLILVETVNELAHGLVAIEVARSRADLPVLASMTFGEDLAAIDGTTPEAAAEAFATAGADAVGVNCGAGPIACRDALERMASAVPGTTFLVMPNAGLPSRAGEGFVYAARPAYLGEAVIGFLATGAGLVGGCCGTTPEHLAGMRGVLDREMARTGSGRAARSGVQPSSVAARSPLARSPGTATSTPETARPAAEPGSAAPGVVSGSPEQARPEPTGLARRLEDEHFVISVEIDPPRSVNIGRTLEAARLVQASGADLVNVSDSAMARVRMGAMAVAFAIQSQVGIECLVHVTTRDRNLMALESELLGAHAVGIRDILALTGDPPGVGDHPGAAGIWDTDSTGLIGILRRLNRGEDQAGRPIGALAGFTIACALDPTADDLDHQLDRLAGKLEAGADLIMTQPIFALEQWERFMEHAAPRFGDRLPRPILLGVLPLHTTRHAEFLHNEVPGITIPARVRQRMRDAGERGAEAGLEMALDLVAELRERVAGIYIMPSFGRYELAAELVRRVRA